MKNNKGFSLVELIVVIAIMAILAAVAIPTFAHFIKKSHEASDAELLHNINYIFNLSCLDNGIDIKDVNGAEWDMENMTVKNVSIQGASDETSAAVKASFDLHFGDLKTEKFYYIEKLVFDYGKKEFVEFDDSKYTVYKYGDGYIYVTDEDLQALKNSTFGKDMGVNNLLDELNKVTILASGMGGPDGKLNVLFSSDEFMNSAAIALGIDITGKSADEVLALLLEKKRELAMEYLESKKIYEKDNPTYYAEQLVKKMNEIDANAAVLYAAQCTAETPYEDVVDWVTAPKSDIVKNNLKNDTTTKVGLTQAALMCGMYTAYVNCEPYKDQVTEGREAVIADNVLWAIDNDDNFIEYLNSDQGEIDLSGYLASLNMINSSTKNNPAAVKELLINGFADQKLKDLMGDALNKTN